MSEVPSEPVKRPRGWPSVWTQASDGSDSVTASEVEPIKTVVVGRTARGTFAPGNTFGPGRPRGVDLKALAHERARAEGTTIEDELWHIIRMQLALAKCGDPNAAKLMLQTFGDQLATEEVAESLAEVIAATIAKNRARLAAS